MSRTCVVRMKVNAPGRYFITKSKDDANKDKVDANVYQIGVTNCRR